MLLNITCRVTRSGDAATTASLPPLSPLPVKNLPLSLSVRVLEDLSAFASALGACQLLPRTLALDVPRALRLRLGAA
jgi:hypothetical protein